MLFLIKATVIHGAQCVLFVDAVRQQRPWTHLSQAPTKASVHTLQPTPYWIFQSYYYRSRAWNTQGNKNHCLLYGKPGNPTASLYHRSLQLTNQSSQPVFSYGVNKI